jgi:plastocyanin
MFYRFLLGASVGLASVLGVVVAPAYAASPTPQRIIFAVDACDSASFNAVFGAGTCVRGPGVPLNFFLGQLQRIHQSPAWKFAPGFVSAKTTDLIEVKNIGGETHTFTEVKKFGGGFVAELNQLVGLSEVRECGNPSTPNVPAPPSKDNHFIPAGGSFTFTEDEAGTHLYQCCIHPWMHETLTVRPSRLSLVTPN